MFHVEHFCYQISGFDKIESFNIVPRGTIHEMHELKLGIS